MRTLIHSVTIVSGGTLTKNAWLEFDAAGLILARGSGDTWYYRPGTEPGGDTEIVDGQEGYLAPGFIDIHGHGGAGHAFDDGPEAIRAALALHRARGTTRSVISLVTGELPALLAGVADIADLAEEDPLILGSHLEGPFLDPAHRGAHAEDLLRVPLTSTVDALIEAGHGTIAQVTLAPELPGAMEAISRFTAAGTAVAVGHTDADYDTARAAFAAGATILTHAFNAMAPIHHRAPGPVMAAVDSTGVILEVINDGIHVHPSVVALAFDAAPGRIALVTDAMAAAGHADGQYRLGALSVTVIDGEARLTEGGAIAGSTLTQDSALRRAVNVVGIELAEAVRALTETPARAIGRGGDLGSLEAGYAADAVLIDHNLDVTRVWAAGREITAA